MRKWGGFIVIISITFILAVMALLTSLKLKQETPVAPTVPQAEPKALEGSPVPACQMQISIMLPSPTPTPVPSVSPTPTPNPTPTPTPTPIVTPSPTPTSSPSPSPHAQCDAIKIYKVTGSVNEESSWQLLTYEQTTALKPQDVIYVTTRGTYSGGGQIDKARIRTNSDTWSTQNETTLTKPSTGEIKEFYITYTLPNDGTTYFNFAAEVHEALTNKWY